MYILLPLVCWVQNLTHNSDWPSSLDLRGERGTLHYLPMAVHIDFSLPSACPCVVWEEFRKVQTR